MHALYTVSWHGILTSYSLLRTPQLNVNPHTLYVNTGPLRQRCSKHITQDTVELLEK
jgi:hypothetical protein